MAVTIKTKSESQITQDIMSCTNNYHSWYFLDQDFSFMHILRLSSTTVQRFIKNSSSVLELLCLREIWTDRQGDSYIPRPKNTTVCAEGIKTIILLQILKL